MKSRLLVLCVAFALAPGLFGADAFDTYIVQRNAGNTANENKTVTAAAGGLMGWDAGKVPVSYAASVFGLAWLNAADAGTGRTALGLGSLATQSGTFSGSSSGTNTGDQTTITGNAGTATLAAAATALATPRTINGVAFDGTADISLPAAGPAAAGTLTGTTLAAGVTASSLLSAGGGSFGTAAFTAATAYATAAQGTTADAAAAKASNLADLTSALLARTNLGLGTLATQSGTFSGTSSGTNTGDQTSVSGSSGSTTGNAATATALQTARSINGTSFDATADITVPAAAGTLTGATLASGVTASSLTSAAGGSFASGAFAAAGASVANATGTAGLTAVNGAAATAMRSDGAPAISQAIVPTWTGVHQYSPTLAANTSGDGILLKNTGTASSGNQMLPPRVRFSGAAWKLNTTAASQAVDAYLEFQPVQGGNPTRTFIGASSINNGAYTNFLLLDESGGRVQLGFASSVGSGSALALGITSAATGQQSMALSAGAAGATAAALCSIVLGSGGSNTTSGHTGSIVLGSYSASTAAGQFVVGGNNSSTISEVYLGKGVTWTSAADVSINITGGSGSNNAGGALKLAPGRSTGTAAPKPVTIQSTVLAASGSTPQTLTDTFFFYADGLQIPNNLSRVSTQYDATTTTLGNVTGLTSTVTAGSTYSFEAVLHITADATGGIKLAIGGTATATSIIYQINVVANSTSANAVTSRQTALAGAAGVAADTSYYATIKGSIVVNAAGTLTAQAAENAASGTSSVLVGSTFQVTKI